MKLSELKQQQNKTKKFKPLAWLENKSSNKAFVIFTFITILFVVLEVSMYPLLKKEFVSQSSMLEFTDISTYFGSLLTQNLLMMGGIYVAYLATNIITSNFKNNSAVLLYSQNYSRNEIIFVKYSKIVLNALLFTIITSVAGFVSIAVIDFNSIIITNFLIMMLMSFVVYTVIGTIMFSVGLLFNKLPSFVGAGVVVVLSIFSSLATLSESLRLFKLVNPISIIESSMAKNVMVSGFASVNIIALITWSIIALVSIVVGIITFNKKDIT